MIPLFKVAMNSNIDKSILEIMHSGMITQGNKVEEFEEKLKQIFNHPYILTLNSATAGLTLAHRLYEEDNTQIEVLSTPLTCFATNVPIMANRMKIKWVDVDIETCNMDLEDLKRKITNKTKILTFVHWGGNPINYKRLYEILDEKEQEFGFRIKIIEDCAHGLFSKYNNDYIGKDNISVFSLQAIKHLTTGDGGLIFLPNKELYERAKLLRWFGIDRDKRNYKKKDLRLENDIKEWGYKFHMNDINATIGLSNLEIINDNITQHKFNFNLFNEKFKNLKNIKTLKQYGESSSWIYTLIVDDAENFIEFMKQRNIMASQVHKRNDVHSCLSEFKTELPNLDFLENKYVCIPCGWWVQEQEQNSIINSVLEYNNNEFEL